MKTIKTKREVEDAWEIRMSRLGVFPSAEAAKSACDAKLRELGFVLEEE